jgi:SagB-type dehydrogenase family enzyme
MTIISFMRQTEIREWRSLRNRASFTAKQKSYPRLRRYGLAQPSLRCDARLVDVIAERRTASSFKPEMLSASDLSEILASVGRRRDALAAEERRAYPSAGARYPIELYLISLRCEGVPPGLYHYSQREHELEELWPFDFKQSLLSATGDRRVEDASAVFVLTIVFWRILEKYGDRGLRYAFIEAGHVAQNISLLACALKKGCVELGGFVDSDVNRWLDIDTELESATLLLMLGGA